jgi:hypothetical protein
MEFSVTWLYVFAVIGGLVAAWRIYQNLRELKKRQNDSWDAKLIDQLRKRGSDPFRPYDVDFFFAFSQPEGAQQLATQLRSEGFDADVKDTPENGDLRYSMHAHKSMQLTVPDMQELSRRLTETATMLGGRYDGWSAQQAPAQPSN